MKPLFVVTKNYSQYLEYCRLNKLNPHCSHIVSYVSNPYILHGNFNPNVVFYGNYNDRTDIKTIKETIKALTKSV